MRYLKVTSSKNNYSLKVDKCEKPAISAHDVLIKTYAAGVNRADIFQAEGSYSPPEGASEILGLEVSGEIVETGQEVKTHSVGDKVCALLQGGGYAEYVSVPEWRVLPVPEGVDMEAAAGISETFFTAYLNLFELARLKPNETVLIHGGASGVGTSAIQLAKVFNTKVIITAGTDEKCKLCKKLGADKAINYKKEDFVKAVKEATEGRGADIVLDIVGGDYFQKNLSALAKRGRMICLSFLNGSKAKINMAPLLMKNITIIGSTLRSRSEEEIYDLAQSVRTVIWPLFEQKKISPVIDSIVSFEEADKAHKRMKNFKNTGKIILKIS